MNQPDKRIVDFVKKHHVMTLATSSGNIPWTAHCFYAYLEEKNWLLFTSDLTTRHMREAGENPEVSGGIVLETSVLGKIQGIQFRGRIRLPDEGEEDAVKRAYITRFPVALLMETRLWILEPAYIKMTDNRLGFGKKLIWGDVR